MNNATFLSRDFPMDLCSFGIEIDSSKYFDGNDPDYAAMGITCGAALSTNGKFTDLFWAGMFSTGFTPRMDEFEIAEMIEYLLEMDRQGFRILTWNGVNFDLRLLATLAPAYKADLRKAMLNSVDLMFQYAVCQGMDLAGKSAGPEIDGKYMDGKLAADLWPERASEVLQYVTNDVVQPLHLVKKIHETKRGREGFQRFGQILTVQDSLSLPVPDTSWMTGGPQATRESVMAFWQD